MVVKGKISVWMSLIFIVSGCSNAGTPPPFDGDPIIKSQGAVPYIEEIVIPEPVVAEEFFEVELHVSSDAHPEHLAGLGINDISGFITPPGVEEPDVLVLDMMLATYKTNGGATRTVFRRPLLMIAHPGNYRLKVLSTKTRSIGGSMFETILSPFPGVVHNDNLIYKELAFTVLPAN